MSALPDPLSRPARIRVESIDAFRGLTIALMIFVIAVGAGNYRDLPQKMSWFGSLPVSTWNHADNGWERFYEEKFAAGMTAEQIEALPEAKLKNIGFTVTDWVAPFFIFIVGLVIPLSKSRHGREWWHHVLSRTAKLILAGVLYISLILGLSWWWGILQAIGIAYLMGAAMMKLPRWGRWAAVFAVLGFHALMSEYAGWWLGFGHSTAPYWRISNPLGDWMKPLTIHCLPWVSISYGAMTMIGVLLGEAVVTGDRQRIIRRAILLAGIFLPLGYLVHRLGFITGDMRLCFNKPDVSASYAMFSSGLASLFFLALYYLIDVWRLKKWAWPFVEFGKNALLAYFMQIIMRIFFRALHLEYFFAGQPNDALKSWASVCPAFFSSFLLDKTGYNGMLWGLIWTVCLWIIILWCNRREIIWKL